MRRSEQEQLLNDILAERDLSHLRESTLQSGLLALQAHRKRRRARRTLILATVPFLLGSVFLIDWRIRPMRGSAPGTAATAAGALLQKEDSGVKIISDDELFALFPNRSLALVGKPGHQELVFLDQGGSSVTSTQ